MSKLQKLKVLHYFLDFNILFFWIRNQISKPRRKKQLLKEEIRKGYDMAGSEWFKIELFESITKIPDELLPFLGDQIYRNGR